jgi:signal transduction histidine kinase
VSAERTGGRCRFIGSDNGIGIDPDHRERIFGMFKRLHTREDYPGIGIGLALVKKIIEQHGGQVGVTDRAAGVGAQFWFTLPAGPDTPP